MSLATKQDRRLWLNTLLETALCGEIFLSESKALIKSAKSLHVEENPLASSDLFESIEALIDGDYMRAMVSPAIARDFFSIVRAEYTHAIASARDNLTSPVAINWLPALANSLYTWVSGASESEATFAPSLASHVQPISEREHREIFLVIVSIASLNAFTQVNYAGIPLTKLPETQDSLSSTILYALLDNSPTHNSAQQFSERVFQLTALKLNGEDVYPCVHFPMLLLLARAVLSAACVNAHTRSTEGLIAGVMSRIAYGPVDPASEQYQTRLLIESPLAAPAMQVWSLRALNAHQDALIDQTVSVRVELHQLMNQLGSAYGVPAMLNTANRPVDTASGPAESVHDFLPEFMEEGPAISIGASPFDPSNMSIENTRVVLDPDYTHALAPAFPTSGAPASVDGSITNAERFARSIRACVCLEVARLCRGYWQHQCAQRLLFAVSVLAGFRTALTGVMGKRTKYQVRSHAQLVVVCASEQQMLVSHAAEREDGTGALNPTDTALYDCVVPADAPTEAAPGVLTLTGSAARLDVGKMDLMPDIPLDTMDDVYLATPALDADPAQAMQLDGVAMRGHHLSWLGHLACLSHAEHIHTSNPSGDLTSSEELAYVNASLLQQSRLQRGDGVAVHGPEGEVIKKNVLDTFESVNDLYASLAPWASHALALHLRSRLELTDHRRQVRSLAQLETIGSVFKNEQLMALQPHDSACGLHRVQATADTVSADTEAAADELMSQLATHAALSTSLTMAERRLRLTRWRMSALYTTGCPSWWHHKRAYAEIATQAKLRQTALDAFVEIGMWEQVMESLIELGRKGQAETLIRSRLPGQGWLQEVDGDALAAMPVLTEGESQEAAEVSPGAPKTITAAVILAENHIQHRFTETATLAGQSSHKKGLDLPEHKLWSLLGDIRDEPAYWHKSWEVSNESFPRAKRALGRYYFLAKDWHRAYLHFKDALAVNSARPEVWFACGVCALELRRFGEAIEAFSRTAGLHPDHAEAWNNLAACHLHCENTRAAFGALEHAVLLKRDSWKMWENYLNCALSLQEYQKAANALGRLCTLRGTTDAGTLLPVQYSGSQAQLHMFAAAVLTDAATADARKAFRSNMRARRGSTAPVSAFGSQDTNVPVDQSVLEQSFLSFQVLSVVTQMEAIAGSMVAHENSLGGRSRGGGVEAGMGNSIAAEMDLRARVAADRERKAKERQDAPEDEEKDEEVDYDEDEAGDVVSALESARSRPTKPRVLDSRMVAANSELVYSLAQRYQVFIADCLARLHAGVQQYVAAAHAREKQAMLMMREGADWARDAAVLHELEEVTDEAVRLYRVAADVDKAVSKEDGPAADNRNGTSEMNAAGCYTAARFFTARVAAALQQAERAGGGDVIPPIVRRLQQVTEELEGQARAAAPADAEVLVNEEAPRDEYAAYTDNYDSYW